MRLKRRTETFPWDPADGLDTDEERIAYLDAALEENDPLLVAAVLGDIARSKGMEEIVAEAGLVIGGSGEPSTNGSPELETVLKVVRALGLCLKAAAAAPPDRQ